MEVNPFTLVSKCWIKSDVVIVVIDKLFIILGIIIRYNIENVTQPIVMYDSNFILDSEHLCSWKLLYICVKNKPRHDMHWIA